ncbi:uncharacterized protein LOC132924907 [Rhopalosiphum padi]|uniref:uncharacterized protein LOC132924907 n=1 Tax=Rhopalosiphum padi TaxID=40932 RepID=UPI00298E5C3B|nr:uncharacterized protein LOC132924907 [Rhopalosiphum padi]
MDTDANAHLETDNVGDVLEADDDDDINAKTILRQQLSLPNNYESNEEVNHQPPSATDSDTIFQREIVDKDPKDSTYGDGFEIDQVFGPILIGEELYYHLQWRKGIHSGVGVLEATTIYDKWPDEALTFYQKHYKEN